MSHAHDAQRASVGCQVVGGEQMRQRSRHPLQYAAGVAPFGAPHLDRMLAAVAGVYMVVSDRGGGYEPDARRVEQRCIASGARSYQHGVAVGRGACVDQLAALVKHFGVGFEQPPDERNVSVDNYFHRIRIF